ncbi:cytochrome o ubiquinol oxidase subunit III [Kangiella sp. HZ709]|uniref:cytochrome o ubiquinol oxidase subunit III n=1 Tax=Kangiella sp. HZ709 TaxID=2666328 RepID=UPI0012B07709|nr:cytochrome o ubiquinol oxidase subunit III [Kangiella sp. HZ709]MRX26829.1 cytochrome o ubiquinol oxidase subunit III [Kangiella sp. HZ709]
MNATLGKPRPGFTGYVTEESHHDYAGDTVFGFWVYILSDCILFATLFAVYAVIGTNYVGSTDALELFDLGFVLGETALLLLSSFTFGMAMLEANKSNMKGLIGWLGATFVLGLAFLVMEVYEFVHFTQEGAAAWDSGAWSAFYALIGTHGLHVFAGMIWMIVLVIMILKEGLTGDNRTRLMCLSLFWHFLDIIWICVFSFVYLMRFV